MEDIVKYLKALVFLQVNQQTGGTAAKPEVLLQKAGLKVKEIAEILGKKENAVGMTISRAKAAAKENEDGE
jgi:hypothetical protein